MGLILTPATLNAEEIDAVHEICATNPDYWRSSGDFDPDDVPRAGVEQMLREAVEDSARQVVIARDLDGRLAGFAELLLEHPRTGHAWIGLLIIDGRLRRQGHGRTFVTALEDRFRQTGRDRLSLAALEANPAALAFWTSLGYQEVYRAPDLEKGRPSIVLHKDL
jgi:GNAT superfamily N-acetyltransferase